MVKIGQIGIGHNHGAAKMATARKFPELFEIVGFCEDNETIFEKRAGNRAYEGLKRLTEAELLEKCDALFIETDVPELNNAALRALHAGKHIHLDKPGCEDLSQYKKMLDLARSKNLTVQLGYMYRYNPAVRKCLEMYEKGELGEILSITAEMSTRHAAEYRQWLGQFQGGTMYIFGSHLIDLVMLFLGAPARVTPFLKKSFVGGVESFDNDLCVLEYEKALAKIYTSSNECNGWGRRQFTVCGTEKSVEIRPLEVPCIMTVASKGDGEEYFDNYAKEVTVPTVPDDCRYDEMLRDFYRYVTGEAVNPYTYEYEYQVQKALLEACNVEVNL